MSGKLSEGELKATFELLAAANQNFADGVKAHIDALTTENERLNRDLTAIGDQNGAPTTYHGNVLTPEGRLNSFIGDLKHENERLTRELGEFQQRLAALAVDPTKREELVEGAYNASEREACARNGNRAFIPFSGLMSDRRRRYGTIVDYAFAVGRASLPEVAELERQLAEANKRPAELTAPADEEELAEAFQFVLERRIGLASWAACEIPWKEAVKEGIRNVSAPLLQQIAKLERERDSEARRIEALLHDLSEANGRAEAAGDLQRKLDRAHTRIGELDWELGQKTIGSNPAKKLAQSERDVKHWMSRARNWRDRCRDHDRLAAELAATKQALADAQQALNRIGHGNAWTPDVCPITGREFFGWIKDEHGQYHPTYGDARTCYTIPVLDAANGNALHDRDLVSRKYDHDLGGWTDYEIQGVRLIDDERLVDLLEAESELKESKQALADALGEVERVRAGIKSAMTSLKYGSLTSAYSSLSSALATLAAPSLAPAKPAASEPADHSETVRTPVMREGVFTEEDLEHAGKRTKPVKAVAEVEPAPERRFVCPRCGSLDQDDEGMKTKGYEPLICGNPNCDWSGTWAEVEAAKGDIREDELECTLQDEEAAHQDTLRLWEETKQQLAAANQAREAERQRAEAAEAANGVLSEALESVALDYDASSDVGFCTECGTKSRQHRSSCIVGKALATDPGSAANELRALRKFASNIKTEYVIGQTPSDVLDTVKRALIELDQSLSQGEQRGEGR